MHGVEYKAQTIGKVFTIACSACNLFLCLFPSNGSFGWIRLFVERPFLSINTHTYNEAKCSGKRSLKSGGKGEANRLQHHVYNEETEEEGINTTE